MQRGIKGGGNMHVRKREERLSLFVYLFVAFLDLALLQHSYCCYSPIWKLSIRNTILSTDFYMFRISLFLNSWYLEFGRQIKPHLILDGFSTIRRTRLVLSLFWIKISVDF